MGYGEKEAKGVSPADNVATTGQVSRALRQVCIADPKYLDDVARFLSTCRNQTETKQLDPAVEKHFAERGIQRGDDGGFFYSHFRHP